ncbi:hypothetical protein V8E54_002371 [Elaphomyces granulatus]
MPSIERDGSRDRDLVVRNHQHSLSEINRSSIPMWDSSDPDRAPPPLPMNPSSNSPKTRANAAPAIQAAAASLTEKMRENTPSSYTTNPMPLALKSSPEKSLIKGQYHRRMQSLQNTGDARSEFRNYLETRSPERPLRASPFDNEEISYDMNRTEPRTSTSPESVRESPPSFHIPNRFLSKPILGESTPPSATMLALQTMQIPEESEPQPSSVSSLPPMRNSSNQSLEALSAQILSLTGIATDLQCEMAQLSRRSKDNATDLLSLKAATNARDEDIRKSIRDLAANISSKFLDPEVVASSPPSSRKSYTLPRVPSPGSLAAALERDLCGSPGPISDGSASIALLEKVLREMATKEAQEKLLELVDEMKKRPTKDGANQDADKSITKLLEEIHNLVKDSPLNRALIPTNGGGNDQPPRINIDFADPSSGPLTRAQLREDLTAERDMVTEGAIQRRVAPPGLGPEDIMETLKRVTNSVTEGGGLTNEVKALVRELRGEVLGMGREIARKLEEALIAQSAEDKSRAPGKEEISAIVESGLEGLREQMGHMVQEHQREMSSSISQQAIDREEIYTAIKAGFAEIPLPQAPSPEPPRDILEKEDILETVREAWETYKPEIELQNFGLERDEILECLSEGLKAYQPKQEPNAIYDQALAAVQAGLQDYVPPMPPPVEPQPSITRDDIVAALRECLEVFEFPSLKALEQRDPGVTKEEILSVISEVVASQNALTRELAGSGVTREDVLGAVTEALAAHHAAMKEMEEPQVTSGDMVLAEHAESMPELSTDKSDEPVLSREEVLNAIAEGLASQAAITREIELNKDDIYSAVSSGLQEVASSTNINVGDQILNRLQELIQDMKTEFQQYSAANGRDTEQVLDAMKDGLEVLRRDVESYVGRTMDVSGKEEIVVTVKEGFRLLQADLERTINDAAAQSSAENRSPDTPELLDAMDKEFEHLRQTISSHFIQNNTSSDKDEIIDAIRDLSENSRPGNDMSDVVNVVKDEFEHLRDTISMSMVKSEPSDKDDILAVLKESFQALQAETIQKRDEVESSMSNTSELLDAFNDGVDAIRGDLEAILNKPQDNASTDILEALREGLMNIRTDMQNLRESQKEYEETSTVRGKELILANENAIGSDIENLKILITQLQIKVDSIEPRADTPVDVLKKEDLDEVLTAVKEVQDSVAQAGVREISIDPAVAQKDDTNAIETLLQDTKAKIDELAFSYPDDIVKSEQIQVLEVLALEAKDALNELSVHVMDGPTKAEIGTLETLMKDIWVAVDDIKTNRDPTEEDPEKLLKSDLQTVEAMIFAVKTQIEDLKLPDVEVLPTKSEIDVLNGLVAEFREKFEGEAELTAQAFEARKVEHGGLADKIEEAKLVVNELGDELKSKLDGSERGLSELRLVLESLAASVENFNTVQNIQELTDLIAQAFERAREEQDATKLEAEERDAAALIKQDEVRTSIVIDLGTKVDSKLDEVMAKYDELQMAIDSKFAEVGDQEVGHLEALMGTKGIAEDIKLIIGAMGNSMSETCDKISGDTKTFIEKVEESYVKLEEMQFQIKDDQGRSTVELEKAAATADRVEREILEFQPQILDNLKDILSIVSQHYTHSQRSTEEIKMDLMAVPSTITPLLPALPPPEPKEIPVPEKYDDSEVHSKLDELLDHAQSANKSMSQIDKLDEIHEKVLATSREVTDMVTTQSMLLLEDHERKKREAEAAAIALEKRIAQKDKVEAEIVSLNEEKDSLLSVIQLLKQEKEELTKQNTKLTKQLSGLETALGIRQEEMQLMAERAESLERKILEGVLDHARSVLLSRPGSSGQGMNLKRIPSFSSTTTKASRASTSSTAKDSRSIFSSGVGMALKRRSPAKSGNPGSTTTANSGKERRILSLSHVTGNRGSIDRQAMMAPGNSGGLANLKRSHSVKSNLPSRKTSWGTKNFVANKENEAFHEDEEHGSGSESDTGTERRTSYTGTYTESMLYGTGSSLSTDPTYSSSVDGVVGDDLEQRRNETGRSQQAKREEDQTIYDENTENWDDAPEERCTDLEKLPQSDSGIGADIQ